MKSLHREVAEAADREGVSLNMFVATALGKAVGEKANSNFEIPAYSYVREPKHNPRTRDV